MTKSNLFHNSDIVYQVYFAGKKKKRFYDKNSAESAKFWFSIPILIPQQNTRSFYTFKNSDQGTLPFKSLGSEKNI